jgi:hypothetical protein
MMRWDQFLSASSDWMKYSYRHEFHLRVSNARLKYLDKIRKQWHSAKYSHDLLELLDLGRDSLATDAKDNIYGILGLANPQDQSLIRVDYKRPITYVYAETTAVLISKYQSLDFIVNSFWRRTEASQTWLPSWVVDYGAGSYDYVAGPLGGASMQTHERIKDRCYTASSAIAPCARNDEDALKLRIEVVTFDKVIETLESDESLTENYHLESEPREEDERYRSDRRARPISQWRMSWILSAVRLIQSSSGRRTLPSDPRHILQRPKDIVRILTEADYDPVRGNYRSIEENNDMLDSIVRNIESLNDDVVRGDLSSRHNDHQYFFDDIEYSPSSTWFTTERGFVGRARYDPRQSTSNTGPVSGQSVHKDDIVVVPLGAIMPWVLRKTDVKGEYKLISACAVQEIMYGELMPLVESGHLETQRITLV